MKFFLFSRTVRPSISNLLACSSPPTIARLIITVIINPVNRMSGSWSKSHISYKVIKTQPTFTDLYPSATVIFIANIIDIVTASFHIRPHHIFRRCSKRLAFIRHTSAGLRQPSKEATLKDIFLVTANTNATPIKRFLLARNSPAIELLARKVYHLIFIPKFIGTLSGTGCLSTEPKPSRISSIFDIANWASAFNGFSHGINYR